jgi:hypothetical protein
MNRRRNRERKNMTKTGRNRNATKCSWAVFLAKMEQIFVISITKGI